MSLSEFSVSLVIANYNNCEYLIKCFSCITNQTHSNFEVIVVDDCSTDESIETIKAYAKIDKRFRFYENKVNLGVSLSLNIAISYAKFDYILRHDPDDFLVDNAIELLLTRMLEGDVDIVSGQALAFGSQSGLTSWPLINSELKKALLIESPIHQPCALIKKSVIDELKYSNVPSEDYDLWIRAAKKGFKFANVPELITYYRRHSTNLTMVKKDEIFYEHIPKLRKLALQTLEPSLSENDADIFSRALDHNGLTRSELVYLPDVFDRIFPEYQSYSHSLKKSLLTTGIECSLHTQSLVCSVFV